MGDQIEPGSNADLAGLIVGDQLLYVNKDLVMGESFDSAMSSLVKAPQKLNLQLYRGSMTSLFTILRNRDAFPDEVLGSEEEVIMDENYEDYNDKPLTPGDVMKALGKLGGAMKSNEPELKKKKGLFGGMFCGETVQLEGDDATGLGR